MPYIGGATISLLSLCKHIKSLGHDVQVLFTLESGNAFELFTQEGIPYLIKPGVQIYGHAYGAYNSFKSRRPWRPITNLIRVFSTIPKAEKILREINPDVVYLNTSVLLSFAIASKRLKMPMVWHLREQLHDGHFGLRKRIVKSIFSRNADIIISISKENKRALGLEKTEVIYNSVNFKLYDRIKKNVTNWKFKKTASPSSFVCLFLGGSVHSKGADVLIEGFLKASEIHMNLVLLIAGKFERYERSKMNAIEKKVDTLIKHYINTDRLYFLGVLKPEEVAESLFYSNVLIWPATVPHFARPIMEAMAMGKPVIASDFPSSRELVNNKENGILIPPTAQEIKKSLAWCIHHKEELLEMGEKNSSKARLLFDETLNNARIMDKILESWSNGSK